MDNVTRNGEEYGWVEFGGDFSKCLDCELPGPCGACEQIGGYFKKIKEVKEEQLYICSHAEASCECMGLHYKPKHENDPMRYNGRCMNRGGIEVKSIPYTEEKEPKTKKVWIIQKVELDKRFNCVNDVTLALYDNNGTQIYSSEIDPIWSDRIQDVTDSNYVRHIAIKPPTPEPETVDQVLDDLFGMEDRHSLSKGIIDSFKSRIKAAQEREV